MKPTKTEILQKYYTQRTKRANDQTLYQKMQSGILNNSLQNQLILKGLRHEIIDCKNELTKINKLIKKLENEINN